MLYQTLRWPLLLSIAAAVVTIVMKATAYLLTGSVGLFSDALESGVNLLAAVAATFSLWYANKPRDASHPYGHEKIEFFSSGLEGVLICLAGVVTIYFAIERLILPKSIVKIDLGVVLAAMASLINFAVAVLLLRIGKRHGSIILEADGHHLMTDVLTTVAVIAGLGLVAWTGLTWFDPALALLVGCNIVLTGFKLIRRSFDGLMDRSWPIVEQDTLRSAIRSALPAGTDFHLLRTRQAGRRRFVDFHLLVDGATSVRAGHELAHRVEDAIRVLLPELEVSIHIEPIEETTSWETAELQHLGETTQPLIGPGSDLPLRD